MTFLLALFMALAKRRDDVLIYLETGEKMRKVVDGYNLQSLDAAMAIMAPESLSATTITQHLQE
jgi:decaprenyl-phosphate phosphoribosyltransferase